MDAAVADLMDHIDTDGSGELSLDELSAFAEQLLSGLGPRPSATEQAEPTAQTAQSTAVSATLPTTTDRYHHAVLPSRDSGVNLTA